ncbi:hypothetical protein B0H13DRAFT_1853429 [Mycena leptocephala]|nr:hypothetical protein B0H13DRAFT_1853429 [Mycena leptocephala]
MDRAGMMLSEGTSTAGWGSDGIALEIVSSRTTISRLQKSNQGIGFREHIAAEHYVLATNAESFPVRCLILNTPRIQNYQPIPSKGKCVSVTGFLTGVMRNEDRTVKHFLIYVDPVVFLGQQWHSTTAPRAEEISGTPARLKFTGFLGSQGTEMKSGEPNSKKRKTADDCAAEEANEKGIQMRAKMRKSRGSKATGDQSPDFQNGTPRIGHQNISSLNERRLANQALRGHPIYSLDTRLSKDSAEQSSKDKYSAGKPTASTRWFIATGNNGRTLGPDDLFCPEHKPEPSTTRDIYSLGCAIYEVGFFPITELWQKILTPHVDIYMEADFCTHTDGYPCDIRGPSGLPAFASERFGKANTRTRLGSCSEVLAHGRRSSRY